ncbi:WxcM-like domain-containing protein [Myroides sp. JBRI-B21084]|uniref:WxcM-like domain-containing protein n=1 Tax=Myroides sp. JBRI-B21084 TaxID=3119977 RepID=UPI0026E2A1B2|nr:WxcM-like domain-containing protein [Paenimyroides cloacae]WKW45561.1 WxcM-like domain-containing protein [Paenimyroides cloacae]
MLLEGKKHQDERGIITYNNDFDASKIKRIYTIENHSTEFIRGWQGHKIEQRWFACMKGSFEISVIQIDDFEKPSKDGIITKYFLAEDVLTYLHVPAGCITAIQAKENNSKLLVLSDYAIGEINDEYRFEVNYFDTYNQ